MINSITVFYLTLLFQEIPNKKAPIDLVAIYYSYKIQIFKINSAKPLPA